MKALIISADNFEDSELLVPYYRLKEAHIEVEIASMKLGTIKGKHGYEVAVDKTLDAVNPEEYALLVLPGGKAPEKVRKEIKAIEIARSFFEHHKPVAAICHGPQTLISAGLLMGKHATCYRSVAEELKEAGALYENRDVVIDGNLVTSREPSDLPAFMRETMKMMITCSLEFEEKSPTALHPNSKVVKPSGKNQVKGHAVCSHCGNEADIWVDS